MARYFKYADRLKRRPGEACVVVLILILLATHLVALGVVDRGLVKSQIIAGDGLFYYEYLPSAFLDHDLHFSNQRDAVKQFGIPYGWDAPYLQKTATGLPGNPFPIGWALAVAPFFLVGHLVSEAAAAAGFDMRLDGYGLLDQFAANLGAVLFGLLGIYFCFLALRKIFDEKTSGIAVVFFVACSNLPYYIVVHASMSHAVAFFCTAWATLCLITIFSQDEKTPAIQFGLASGLALLSRPQLAPVVAVLYLAALWCRRSHPRQIILSGLLCAAVASLQLVVWKTVYGDFLLVPQGDSSLTPASPHLLDVLFSLKHGFVTWTPFVAVAIIGVTMGLVLPDHRPIYLVFLLASASQVYVNSIAADWWSGNSFGYRRLIEIYPMLLFGVARMMTLRRRSFSSVAVLAAICAIFNALFFVQYRFCYIPRGETITFQQLLIDKLRLYKLERNFCATS